MGFFKNLLPLFVVVLRVPLRRGNRQPPLLYQAQRQVSERYRLGAQLATPLELPFAVVCQTIM